MKEIRVLVTGAGGGGIGEQVIKALQIGELNYFVLATDTRKDSIASCIGDAFTLLPLAREKHYIDSVINCCKEYDCKVIIPGSEPELVKIAENIDLFNDNGIYVPINSIELINLCKDKIKFNEFLKQNNFAYCETIGINYDDRSPSLIKFPYVLKPTSGSGSKDVFIVQTQTELNSIIEYLGKDNEFLLQEYVGTAMNEYTVGILCTPERGYINHITLKRDLSYGLSVKQRVQNRTTVKSLGDSLVISTGISQGTFVENPLIDNVVHQLVEKLNPTSTINMQCRIHENKVYIFEINPRFSGTTNLRAIVGFNEPEFIIKEHFKIHSNSLDSINWKNKSVLRGIREYLVN